MNIKNYIKSEISKKLDIQLFANNPNTNVTTQTGIGQDLSPEMKEFWDTQLLENAREGLYHTQFGKKTNLPKGNGKRAEWRKANTFAPSLTPLTEGVTPDGEKFGVTSIYADIEQYGQYAVISDVLEMTAYDPIIDLCNVEMGAAGSLTADLLCRNELVKNPNVIFAPKSDGTKVEKRQDLDGTCELTPRVINKAQTILKKNKTPKINGSYVGLIHPSIAMDLRETQAWIDSHKYAAVKEIFNGEIGDLHGVRFIETDNEKVWKGTANNCPTGYSVYATLIMGKDAYGIIDPEGMGMEMIVKGKGSSGVSDALNQRSSVGYKFSTATKMLYLERLIRIESVSPTFEDDDETN